MRSYHHIMLNIKEIALILAGLHYLSFEKSELNEEITILMRRFYSWLNPNEEFEVDNIVRWATR